MNEYPGTKSSLPPFGKVTGLHERNYLLYLQNPSRLNVVMLVLISERTVGPYPVHYYFSLLAGSSTCPLGLQECGGGCHTPPPIFVIGRHRILARRALAYITNNKCP